MGKGSRPEKAKVLVLAPGTAVTAVEPEGGVAAPEPAYPAEVDAIALADPATPDEVLTALNQLALEGVVDEAQFQQLYLHQFGHLGATPGAAHQQWEALKAEQEADQQAAAEIAERMQAAVADVQPWNPLDDPARAKAELDQMRSTFNAAVQQARQEGQKRGLLTAGYLKDRIAQELGQRSGLGYKRANQFVGAWAGTANDHSPLSIAMQVATADKLGLELTDYVAKVASQLGSEPDFAHTREEARHFVDAMYERTQEWLSSRGVKELVLFRGANKFLGATTNVIGADTTPVDAAPGPIPATVHLNPLNSWTASWHTVPIFSTWYGYVLTARVPAHKVIGCCFTGLGCLGEQEFVVAGGSGQKVTAATYPKAGYGSADQGKWDK
jgi:hypothetical protein